MKRKKKITFFVGVQSLLKICFCIDFIEWEEEVGLKKSNLKERLIKLGSYPKLATYSKILLSSYFIR